MSQSPLYLQIKQYITDKIDSGHWPVGHRISTELKLTEQFKVSRMTVNKAIRDLVAEGKLQRRPRVGTFVCAPDDKAESPLLDIQNIAEEVKLRGKTYSSKVIKQASMLADETVAIKLGVMLNSPIFYSEIIHFEDNSPIQYELRWVNSAYAPDYLEQDFTQITPNQYLSENCPLSAIEHTVEAIVADDEVRTALRLGANEPCLLLNRRTWSQDKLVSSALLYHPGTRYKLSSKILLG
ncbi:histidine utilization repressor [Vibrio coralliilyticus]|uniref:histidine utilization repressor n=1 Tax=Vibrio coralliilyticus TaxID=190893 RepID=UPI00155FB3FF|nr:histidine utilization repressor [Vibrio coralliilyticus]NRF28286.1 histidine utilization repressor [Vibrio coralliilyticus]NRF51903.1 histidine utilization repressor [Vibrio coralliilyticus]NRG03888.1 histidine utilization repressor [Vibrio coralliilyticus]